MRIYQLFFMDEYNNLECVGWYENLDDAIDDVNGRLELYGNGKYQLKKGDIVEIIGTFEPYVYISFGDFFSEESKEKSYDDFQCAELRGMVYYIDEVEGNMIKQLFMKEDKSEPIEDLTISTLEENIRLGKNVEVLKALKDMKKVGHLFDSIIDKTVDVLTNGEEGQIDYAKYNIDKNMIHDNNYWLEIEEDYDMDDFEMYQKFPNKEIMGLVTTEEENEEVEKKFEFFESEKSKMKLIGYYVFNLESVEYYLYGDKLCTFLYLYYNEKRALAQVSLHKRKTEIV